MSTSLNASSSTVVQTTPASCRRDAVNKRLAAVHGACIRTTGEARSSSSITMASSLSCTRSAQFHARGALATQTHLHHRDVKKMQVDWAVET